MLTQAPTVAGAKRAAACRLIDEVRLAAPFYQYHRLHADEPYAFLLDSAKPSGRLGQFSFLGADPWLVYKARRWLRKGATAVAQIEIIRRHDEASNVLPQPTVETREAELFDDLRSVLRAAGSDDVQHAEDPLPLPFVGGAVGYFGYEAGHFVEQLPDRGSDDLGLPDVYLMFCDLVLAQCHATGRTFLSVIGRGASDAAAHARAAQLRERMLARIAAFDADDVTAAPQLTAPKSVAAANGATKFGATNNDAAANGNHSPHESSPAAPRDVQAQFDMHGYGRLVDIVKQHIFAGDVFEVCLTHRLEAAANAAPWDIYCELRRLSPAPFAALLQLPDACVISSSPERYVRLDADRVAESRPIKGTRPRGATPEIDAAIYTDLATSVKDRAENVMIVDLVRNDLGRVCKFGTVEVPELMAIESYATVYQMVSTVRGTLRDEADALDLVRASFPGGSMTGAPKIEAMKIIDRLEPVKRGVYSGAIGYFDYRGTMDLSIAIRTIVLRGGRAYFNVGGAVVADSSPTTEYRETLDKAQAMVAALRRANAGNGTDMENIRDCHDIDA